MNGRLIALSRFLSCVGDKAFIFFVALKMQEKFEWIGECKEFSRINIFLILQPILTLPKEGSHLLLYFSITDQAMSLALVQKTYKTQQLVYFIRKVIKGDEADYQKIQKLAMIIVVASRKLRPYFQSRKVLVKTNYPVQQILKKPDLKGRMVSQAVEILEYDIQYFPRGKIKSQVLGDIFEGLSSPIHEEAPSQWKMYHPNFYYFIF